MEPFPWKSVAVCALLLLVLAFVSVCIRSTQTRPCLDTTVTVDTAPDAPRPGSNLGAGHADWTAAYSTIDMEHTEHLWASTYSFAHVEQETFGLLLKRPHAESQESLFRALPDVLGFAPRVMVDLGSVALQGPFLNNSDALLWLEYFDSPNSEVLAVDISRDFAADLQLRFNQEYGSKRARKRVVHAKLADQMVPFSNHSPYWIPLGQEYTLVPLCLALSLDRKPHRAAPPVVDAGNRGLVVARNGPSASFQYSALDSGPPRRRPKEIPSARGSAGECWSSLCGCRRVLHPRRFPVLQPHRGPRTAHCLTTAPRRFASHLQDRSGPTWQVFCSDLRSGGRFLLFAAPALRECSTTHAGHMCPCSLGPSVPLCLPACLRPSRHAATPHPRAAPH